MRFDSKVKSELPVIVSLSNHIPLFAFLCQIVVPTQFVMFNLSAIVGSAILYGDFKQASFHQIVTFLYGCAATFAGVFIIAWAPSSIDEDSGIESMPGEDLSSIADEEVAVGFARSNRAKLVLPDDADATPILRNKHSVVSMYGLSPAQVSIFPGLCLIS